MSENLKSPRVDKTSRVVFFDSKCLLCQKSVRFLHVLTKNDPTLFFAPLGGASAAALLDIKLQRDPGSGDTILFFDAGEVSCRSEAVRQALLKTPSTRARGLAYLLSVVPLGLRDWVYRLVARNRYSWFGTSDSCVFDPELRARLLE